MKKAGLTKPTTVTESDKDNIRFKRVLEASNTGIWEWHIPSNEVFYSSRWKELLGYKDHELPNKFETWQNNLHPDDSERMVKNVQSFLQNPKGNFEHKFRMRHKNGKYVWIHNRSAITLDKDGKPEYMSGSHLDITSQVEQEEIIKKSEARFKSIFENSPLGKSITGIDGKIKINQRFIDLLGYTEQDLNNITWQDISHPDDIEISMEAIEKMKISDDPVNFRKRYIHKDGHVIWTDVSSVAQRDEDGNITNFLTTIHDITDQIKHEQELKESEARFKSLFMSLNIPLCNVNAVGELILVNNQFINTFGYTLKDVPTLDIWWKKAYPDDEYRQWVLSTWNEAVEHAQKKNIDIRSEEYRVTCKDGSEKIIVIGGFTLSDGFLATFVDVTERVNAKREIEEAKEYLETIIQAANAILVVLDNNGNLEKINKAGETIIGRDLKEIKGKNWFELIVPRKRYPEVWDEFERISKGGLPKTFENPILTKNGDERIISWQNSHLKLGNQIKGIVSFGIDVTDKRKAERDLVDANERLKSSNRDLEHFAYVASHDLQEPLRKIKNYIELFIDRYEDTIDDRGNKYLNIVTNGAARMQTLIDDLLQLSRVSIRGKDLTPVDLNEVFKTVIDILELYINEKNATINIENLPVISGDKQQLVQLFQNIISNALKYNNKEPIVKITISETKKQYRIKIEDNGIGFENKFKEKIFDAFQRLHTRNEYSGTGIGLALCKRIVNRHGGKITADSVHGQGSSFYITFPKPDML